MTCLITLFWGQIRLALEEEHAFDAKFWLCCVLRSFGCHVDGCSDEYEELYESDMSSAKDGAGSTWLYVRETLLSWNAVSPVLGIEMHLHVVAGYHEPAGGVPDVLIVVLLSWPG